MFMKKYGHDLLDKVFLKAPSGESFEVTLEEEETKVWLSEGWREFQDYYSLQVGSFIVFELKGNNVFSVWIFDLTSTEIDYPVEGSQSDEYQPSETRETGHSSPAESSDASEPEPKRMRFRQQSQRKLPNWRLDLIMIPLLTVNMNVQDLKRSQWGHGSRGTKTWAGAQLVGILTILSFDGFAF